MVGVGLSVGPANQPDLVPLLPTSSPNGRWADSVEVPGRVLYRFDTVIYNQGGGALDVYRGANDPTTFQKIWPSGTPENALSEVPTGGINLGAAGQIRYSSVTGHNHFHTQLVAAYELDTTAGALVTKAAKNTAGFCLYDSWVSDSQPTGYFADGTICHPQTPDYTGVVREGISPQYGDFYGSQLTDQWVDVTDVTPGSYRLRATVDPDGLYTESDEGDNTTTANVVIPGVGGPAPPPPGGPPGGAAPPPPPPRPAGTAVSVPLAATVVGASVKSRLPTCQENETGKASCMTTATPGAATLAVQQPGAGQGSVRLAGTAAVYTPPAGFTGTATFTYTGTDSRGLTSRAATVTVKVGTGSVGTAGAGARKKGRIRLTARQMLISQRIGQAAGRRPGAAAAARAGAPAPAAARAHAHGRVTLSARQLRINQRIFQAAVRRGTALEARLDGTPPPGATAGGHDRVRLSVRQMVINQHIAQAAVRKANALRARVGL